MVAFTPLESTRNQLAVSWGIRTYRVPYVTHTDDMIWQVDQVLQAQGLAKRGDQVIILAGMPPGVTGSTNSMRIHTVGLETDYR